MKLTAQSSSWGDAAQRGTAVLSDRLRPALHVTPMAVREARDRADEPYRGAAPCSAGRFAA
jgi:hypothetical protein